MHVDKEEVVDLLRSRGEHDKAANVACALPRQVDTEADAGLLHQLGVKVSEISDGPDGGDSDTPVAGSA